MSAATVGKSRQAWDKETVLQDALGYQSRSEWKKASYAYEVASRNGWVEEACAHMTKGKGVYQKGYWTLDKCIEDARKYQTKSSWRNSEVPNGFTVAKRNGWLPQCCQHMIETKKPNGYWKSLENCLKDASRFKHQARWEEESPSAVSAARLNGWLDLCVAHMETPVPYNLKWSKKLVLEDARNFDTVGEWREKSAGAYSAANKNGWLQEAMSHMTFVVSQGEYQVHRFLLERDIRFETQKRFPDCKDVTYLPFDFYLPDFNLLVEYQGVQHVKGYRRDKLDAANIARRDAIKKSFAIDNGFNFLEIWKLADIKKLLTEKLQEICQIDDRALCLQERKLSRDEMSSLITAGIWTLEKCFLDAALYLTKMEWARSSPGAYSAAHSNGWIAECTAHMTALWEKKWTLEACQEDALKHQSKSEWAAKSPNGYAAAHRKNWLQFCCGHMQQLKKPRGYWTLSRCQGDAKKYATKQAWRVGSPSGYVIAKANGWLNLCCDHMT